MDIKHTITDREFGGERPLFESHNLRLERVTIREGESAIKECSDIEAVDCVFEGNYPSGMSTASPSTTVILPSEAVRHCGIAPT